MTTEPDPARARFLVLTLLRVVSALMIGGGVLVAFGDNQWLAEDIRVPVGAALVIIGFIDMIWLVPTLARRWRSPQ
jgi:ABC-type enterobactin transport system permease subunit